MRKPTVLCERAEALFREIQSYSKFEDKFGTGRPAVTAGSSGNKGILERKEDRNIRRKRMLGHEKKGAGTKKKIQHDS